MPDTFASPSSRSKKEMRRKTSPGPGAYDPKPKESVGQTHRKGPSSSFKSTSNRGLEKQLTTKGEGGDPGAYSPYTDRYGGRVALYNDKSPSDKSPSKTSKSPSKTSKS